MEYITATEAQRRYFVTVKTLGKWIKEGTLPARKVTKNKLAQWEIGVEDLERVIADKHTSTPTSTIQALEERVSTLEHRVTELTDTLHALQATQAPHKKNISPEQHAIWSQEAITTNEQSPIVPVADFFKLHGIPESTARRGIGKAFSIAPGGPWIIGGFQVKQVLDQQGQHEFYEAFHDKASFTPCAKCPHNPV